MLQANSKFEKKIFPESPFIAYRKNAKLKQIIGSNSIKHNQKTVKSRKTAVNILRAYRILEHSVVSKLLAKNPLKAHRQNVNSTPFIKSISKVSRLHIY